MALESLASSRLAGDDGVFWPHFQQGLTMISAMAGDAVALFNRV